MARFFVFVVVVGGLALIMVGTKPSQTDYLGELQRRADVILSMEPGTYEQLRGVHPLDAMVAAQPPARLIKQTQFDDYFVITIFTTTYDAPGYSKRRVRTIGLFSTFLAHRLQ